MPIEHCWTISKIRHANKTAGHHFFDPGTMRFFGSRILQYVYQGVGGIYFVTSERASASSDGRIYNVRRFTPETSSVETVKGCYGIFAVHEAKLRARELAHPKP
jgi:hypothetical protein